MTAGSGLEGLEPEGEFFQEVFVAVAGVGEQVLLGGLEVSQKLGSLGIETLSTILFPAGGFVGGEGVRVVASFVVQQEVGQTLGRWLAGLINIFNPEKVVIGGALSSTGDYMLQPIRSWVKRYSLNLVNEDTKIVLSKLGDQAGLIGACLIARNRAFEDVTE